LELRACISAAWRRTPRITGGSPVWDALGAPSPRREPCLSVLRMLPARRTVLAQLHAVRVVALVLVAGIVPAAALSARPPEASVVDPALPWQGRYSLQLKWGQEKPSQPPIPLELAQPWANVSHHPSGVKCACPGRPETPHRMDHPPRTTPPARTAPAHSAHSQPPGLGTSETFRPLPHRSA